MEKLFLGFDAGTQSVKVSVYDASWKCRATYAKPTTLHTPKPTVWKWIPTSTSP